MEYGPKNDDEKWSRKNYFEIPPCGKIVLGQNGIFGYRFHFEGINDVWISQVRRVKNRF